MSRPRRSFSPEYRVEAAHRVIDGHRPVAEVGRELDLHENLLHKWVREERRRTAAAAGAAWRPPGEGGEALTGDELPSWCGYAPRWPSRPGTSRSWKKPRTLQTR